jgi:hypothetical protein
MVIETIVLIIFVCSLVGVLFILARKIPNLNLLPHNGTTGIRKHQIILNVETKIKNFFVFFEKQIFMHKFLSFVKVMTLKIETRIDVLLHKIRKKAQQVDKNSGNKK